MNCQTSQLRRIAYCRMLLVQVSKDIFEPGQVFKMKVLAKIVNGLRFFLRLILWTLKVYLFGPMNQWYEWSNWSYLSITWTTAHWIQGNNRILAITRITWITCLVFHLFLVSISFVYNFWNPMFMRFQANTNDKNSKLIYRNLRTSGLCGWLL